MKIDLTPCKLKNQKPTKIVGMSLHIEETHVRYTWSMWADEMVNDEDEGMGWRNVFQSYDTVALKKNIAGIEKAWTEVNKKWAVYICLKGFNDDIKMFFKTESEATNVFDILLKYITDGN